MKWKDKNKRCSQVLKLNGYSNIIIKKNDIKGVYRIPCPFIYICTTQ